MNHILQAIVAAGGDPIKVGGCIRDELLGLESKDVDVEVFGLSAEALCIVLRRFGKVSIVGESFGVIKLTTEDEDFDFSLPRRDNKTGRGHRGFQVEVDHTMTPAEAALRRDFTINAIGKRLDGQLVDPYGGKQDLLNGVLRAISEHFSEDPLRVLRGFQFASRFKLIADARTLDMCQKLICEADTLAIERIWGEWEKWALKGVLPSLGLRFLVESGWIRLYPELLNLIDVPQDPEWHPEGWELLERKFLEFPFNSRLASSTQTIRVDRSFTLRKFFSSSSAKSAAMPVVAGTSPAKPGIDGAVDGLSAANSTGSLGDGFSATFEPTTFANPESLVWSFGRSAIEAGKIIRIMFKIPESCMLSVVNRAINDFEVIEAIVESVAIFVMNMLTGKEFSPQVQFHQDSMDTNGSVMPRPTGVSVSLVVVDATGSTIDGDVLVHFDLRVNGSIDCHGSTPVYLPSPYNGVELLQKLEEKSSFEVRIGCAWTHTLHVCDAAARICDREGLQGEDRATIILAALCHDLGKALPQNGGTTVYVDENGQNRSCQDLGKTLPEQGIHSSTYRWRSPGHAEVGVPLARRFLERIGCLQRIVDKVLPLVAEHMICMTTSEITDRVVRRLSVRLGKATMKELLLILEADHSGRPPLAGGLPEPAKEIAAIAERLAIEAAKPRPIIGGQHLIDRGFKPGPLFGQVIGECYEAQLDGLFLDEAGAVQHLEQVLAKALYQQSPGPCGPGLFDLPKAILH